MPHCPYCETKVLTAKPVDASEAPGAGDFLICNTCFNWLVFDDVMQLRKPTSSETQRLSADPRFALYSELHRKT